MDIATPADIHRATNVYPKGVVMGDFKVGKWGNSLAIRIPASVAKELGIKEGDTISQDRLQLRKVIPRMDREEALEAIRNTRWKLPEDWKIDRNDPDHLRG